MNLPRPSNTGAYGYIKLGVLQEALFTPFTLLAVLFPSAQIYLFGCATFIKGLSQGE